MRKLLVYADFDWLKEPMLVGELSYESLRGTDSYGFRFDEEWLRTQGSLFLSADLMLFRCIARQMGANIAQSKGADFSTRGETPSSSSYFL